MQEVLRQLSDAEFYENVPNDPSKQIICLIHITVNEACMLGYISDQVAKFLIQKEPRTPLFYLLPKIHKPGFPPKGHPIISGMGSILEPLTQYLDHFYNHLSNRSPHTLRTQDTLFPSLRIR